MPAIVRLEYVGSNVAVCYDDGSKVLARWDGNNAYVMPPIDLSGDGTVAPAPDPGTPEPGNGSVNPAPASLRVTDANGASYTLNSKQLKWAHDMLVACTKIGPANNAQVMRIVLITAIVESVLYMYSNVRHYPETANYPHDRDGSDSDSVGLFQQRPAAGWGSPLQCMTVDYSVRAFLGGSSGPNHGSPRGLFDIAGWQQMTPGRAAQKVQVSAFPTRYDVQVPVANAIIASMVK